MTRSIVEKQLTSIAEACIEAGTAAGNANKLPMVTDKAAGDKTQGQFGPGNPAEGGYGPFDDKAPRQALGK